MKIDPNLPAAAKGAKEIIKPRLSAGV